MMLVSGQVYHRLDTRESFHDRAELDRQPSTAHLVFQ